MTDLMARYGSVGSSLIESGTNVSGVLERVAALKKVT